MDSGRTLTGAAEAMLLDDEISAKRDVYVDYVYVVYTSNIHTYT